MKAQNGSVFGWLGSLDGKGLFVNVSIWEENFGGHGKLYSPKGDETLCSGELAKECDELVTKIHGFRENNSTTIITEIWQFF